MADEEKLRREVVDIARIQWHDAPAQQAALDAAFDALRDHYHARTFEDPKCPDCKWCVVQKRDDGGYICPNCKWTGEARTFEGDEAEVREWLRKLGCRETEKILALLDAKDAEKVERDQAIRRQAECIGILTLERDEALAKVADMQAERDAAREAADADLLRACELTREKAEMQAAMGDATVHLEQCGAVGLHIDAAISILRPHLPTPASALDEALAEVARLRAALIRAEDQLNMGYKPAAVADMIADALEDNRCED